MAGRYGTVFGTCHSGHADRAVDALLAAGFPLVGARLGRGTRLSVHCDTPAQVRLARDLLRSSGATGIATSADCAGAAPAGVTSRQRYDGTAVP